MLRRLTLLLSSLWLVGCAGHVQLDYCFERPITDACFEEVVNGDA